MSNNDLDLDVRHVGLPLPLIPVATTLICCGQKIVRGINIINPAQSLTSTSGHAPTVGQRSTYAYEQICNGPTLAANDVPTIKLWLAHCWATNKLLSGRASVASVIDIV